MNIHCREYHIPEQQSPPCHVTWVACDTQCVIWPLGWQIFFDSFYYTPATSNPKPDYSRLIQDYQNSWFWVAWICRKTNQGLWHSSKCHNASDLIWEFHFQGTIFTKKFSANRAIGQPVPRLLLTNGAACSLKGQADFASWFVPWGAKQPSPESCLALF